MCNHGPVALPVAHQDLGAIVDICDPGLEISGILVGTPGVVMSRNADGTLAVRIATGQIVDVHHSALRLRLQGEAGLRETERSWDTGSFMQQAVHQENTEQSWKHCHAVNAVLCKSCFGNYAGLFSLIALRRLCRALQSD